MIQKQDSSEGYSLHVVQPRPEEAHKMPYAPAVRIEGACDLMFVSGATPSPLYHDHPHRDDQHVHPHAIEDQTRLAMESIKMVLDEVGAQWKDVVKISKYLTDIRDFAGLHRKLHEYFGEWRPASTTLCVNQLSSPGARIEIEVIVALPKTRSV